MGAIGVKATAVGHRQTIHPDPKGKSLDQTAIPHRQQEAGNPCPTNLDLLVRCSARRWVGALTVIATPHPVQCGLHPRSVRCGSKRIDKETGHG